MATTYVTVAEVAGLLRTATFSACTTPSLATVETIINRQEDLIDIRTGHTFGRTKTITQEFQGLPLQYTYGYGTSINLQHRDVRVNCAGDKLHFCAGAGDKLEQWDGQTFTDITANTGDYTLIGTRGQLYIRGKLFTILRDNRLRITYRYGSTTVPGDIKDACVKMTAIDLMNGSFRMDIIPTGGDGAKIFDATVKWKEDVEKIIRDREEVFVIP